MPNFSGIWTVTQQMQAKGASTWPATPGAPTIGTATISAGSTTASVPFTAPACAGYPATITGYLATSTPGCFTATGASSPLSVSGLSVGTAYTFKVKAANAIGYGPCSAASNSITPTAVVGQQAYTSAGTFTFVVPTGVTRVSTVAVGGGGKGYAQNPSTCLNGGGGGGALAYANNVVVTPGESLNVRVGGLCGPLNGQSTYLQRSSTSLVEAGGGSGAPAGGAGGVVIVGTGYAGGAGFVRSPGTNVGRTAGGGGAGGYSGAGGAGGNSFTGSPSSTAGTGGAGGGGGGGGCTPLGTGNGGGGGGGGVGLLGQGSNGAAGATLDAGGVGGGGGSGGGCAGTGYITCCCGSNKRSVGGSGGIHGGGGGGGDNLQDAGRGGLRIIWPGTTRSFPSTCTGNL